MGTPTTWRGGLGWTKESGEKHTLTRYEVLTGFVMKIYRITNFITAS